MKEFVGEQQDKDASLMWEYLNQEEYDYQKPERGEIRQGIVLRKDANEIVLDVGVKLDAVVTSTDLSKLDPEEVKEIQVGDEIAVYILSPEDDGRIIASINMAKSQEDWREAERLEQSGDIFEAEVTGHNKGGLIAPFGRLRGFIPASQVMGLVQRTDSGNRLERLEQMVGRALKLKVIEVNQKRRRLILSERAAMREWRAENKLRLLEELQAGDVRSGVVTNVMNFGAFVDLGGADGLVHVSELAWHRVKHPKDVLEIGEEVEVYVLSVDKEKERIALSIKRMLPDPWSQVAAKYNVGDVVEGEVTNLTDFGAFARIESGIEGLIHISELSDEKVEHPREVLHRGQRLLLRIISIDTERQRIGLSLKRAPQPEPEVEPEELEPDADETPVSPPPVALADEALEDEEDDYDDYTAEDNDYPEYEVVADASETDDAGETEDAGDAADDETDGEEALSAPPAESVVLSEPVADEAAEEGGDESAGDDAS